LLIAHSNARLTISPFILPLKTTMANACLCLSRILVPASQSLGRVCQLRLLQTQSSVGYPTNQQSTYPGVLVSEILCTRNLRHLPAVRHASLSHPMPLLQSLARRLTLKLGAAPSPSLPLRKLARPDCFHTNLITFRGSRCEMQRANTHHLLFVAKNLRRWRRWRAEEGFAARDGLSSKALQQCDGLI
jgi:hypothetical protein